MSRFDFIPRRWPPMLREEPQEAVQEAAAIPDICDRCGDCHAPDELCAPPFEDAPGPERFRLPPADLAHAPSLMEERAASWERKA